MSCLQYVSFSFLFSQKKGAWAQRQGLHEAQGRKVRTGQQGRHLNRLLLPDLGGSAPWACCIQAASFSGLSREPEIQSLQEASQLLKIGN